MGKVTMKDLLESGVHFGHQTRRWDPKMAPYIFTERNGIHIIDLQKTLARIKEVTEMLADVVKEGGYIMFVGTKKQAQASVAQAAEECGMYYVTTRWLGGTLTNFRTIQRSIQRLRQLEKWEVDGTLLRRTKKERLFLMREKEKLQKNIGGVKDMDRLPDALFVVDPKRESIAVAEARKMDIPVFAIVDTNCDPTVIDHVIPGNDDAIRAIKLFTRIVRDTIIDAATETGRVLNLDSAMSEEGSYYSAGSETYKGEGKAEEEKASASTDTDTKEEKKDSSETAETAETTAKPEKEEKPSAKEVTSEEKAASKPVAQQEAKKAETEKSSNENGGGNMAISAADVKKLRDKTGAGMMDCKKALTEAGGDYEKAVKMLREKGLSDAAKRMDRATKEGVVKIVGSKEEALACAEVNCETDFVARNEVFQNFAEQVAKQALQGNDGVSGEDSIADAMKEELKQTIAKLGENITIRRLGKLSKPASGTLVSYTHGGGRISAIVSFSLSDPAVAEKEAFQSYARDIAMQVASMNPVALDRDSVPEKIVKEQEEILRKKAEESGKPADIIDKMLVGQMNKYFEEITLVDQPYIKENKTSVADLTKSVGKEAGADIKIEGYIRFEVGEDLDS